MMQQKDLFDEPRVQIKGNVVLEKAANHLLLLLRDRDDLLDGDTVGEIDKRLCCEFWGDEGLRNIIPSDKWEPFVKFMTTVATEAEVITRARRFLSEQDQVRLPQRAVVKAEQMRSRIAGAMR